MAPQRAVIVLYITQILCWGILIYPPMLTMPLLAAALVLACLLTIEVTTTRD